MVVGIIQRYDFNHGMNHRSWLVSMAAEGIVSLARLDHAWYKHICICHAVCVDQLSRVGFFL